MLLTYSFIVYFNLPRPYILFSDNLAIDERNKDILKNLKVVGEKLISEEMAKNDGARLNQLIKLLRGKKGSENGYGSSSPTNTKANSKSNFGMTR